MTELFDYYDVMMKLVTEANVADSTTHWEIRSVGRDHFILHRWRDGYGKSYLIEIERSDDGLWLNGFRGHIPGRKRIAAEILEDYDDTDLNTPTPEAIGLVFDEIRRIDLKQER